jgi:RNA polymerase sigma factor (sigma-70 family)
LTICSFFLIIYISILLGGIQEIAKSAEKQSFEADWRQVEGKIAGYFFRQCCPEEDARDLCQETALRAWARRDSRKGDFHPWVLGIARYVFLEYLRSKEASTDAEPADGHPGPEKIAAAKTLLSECLAMLDEKRRACLVLHDHDGLGFREIGIRLGISTSNAHYQVESARKHLREKYPELVTRSRKEAET